MPALQKRIDEQVKHFSHTVGVHIRRTDHAIAIASSPTASFFEAMDREFALDLAATFLFQPILPRKSRP